MRGRTIKPHSAKLRPRTPSYSAAQLASAQKWRGGGGFGGAGRQDLERRAQAGDADSPPLERLPADPAPGSLVAVPAEADPAQIFAAVAEVAAVDGGGGGGGRARASGRTARRCRAIWMQRVLRQRANQVHMSLYDSTATRLSTRGPIR